MNSFGLGQPVYAFGLGVRVVQAWREVVAFILSLTRLWSTSVER